jgi:glycyl-tRNA synthetase beta chain
VPQECLILTMKANQKYFPLLDAAGKLTNSSWWSATSARSDASAVIGGNERVVRPRLADAKFFFDQDRKKTLESRVPLDKVVYHNKLGTQGERAERVRAIAHASSTSCAWAPLPLHGTMTKDQLRCAWPARQHQAAALAKTDLLTDMVGEFPELQGIMGRLLRPPRWPARRMWPLPLKTTTSPALPATACRATTPAGVVALADKLETLVGMFGIGNLPTGDKDPFALRRHALGVIRILTEKDLPLTWTLFSQAFDSFGYMLGCGDNERSPFAEHQLQNFFYDRLAGVAARARLQRAGGRCRAGAAPATPGRGAQVAWPPCAPLPPCPNPLRWRQPTSASATS